MFWTIVSNRCQGVTSCKVHKVKRSSGFGSAQYIRKLPWSVFIGSNYTSIAEKLKIQVMHDECELAMYHCPQSEGSQAVARRIKSTQVAIRRIVNSNGVQAGTNQVTPVTEIKLSKSYGALHG